MIKGTDNGVGEIVDELERELIAESRMEGLMREVLVAGMEEENKDAYLWMPGVILDGYLEWVEGVADNGFESISWDEQISGVKVTGGPHKTQIAMDRESGIQVTMKGDEDAARDAVRDKMNAHIATLYQLSKAEGGKDGLLEVVTGMRDRLVEEYEQEFFNDLESVPSGGN